MGILLAPEAHWAPLRERTPTVATLCSHSSLQIFHGARVEGLPSLGIAVGPPAKFYDAFPLARPDKFLSVPKVSALPKEAKRLREEGAILIPHGSFVEYLGPEAFMELDVPVFGNRKVIGWESDREKERVWLESAGVSMPRRYETAADVDGPVIVKYYGAKGGKGFYLAKNREALDGFRPTGPHVIQEYVLGTRYYIHFFYSPLSDRGYRVGHGSLELLGMDRRDEANIDELYKLGAHEELLKAGIRPTFVVTGNVPVVLRESLLPAVFDVGARIVERSIELFGGMVGPFCVEGIMTENLEFKVFEISTRIVAGTNLFISGSSYSDLVQPGLSTGRRIAMEIKRAQREDRLGEILELNRPMEAAVRAHGLTRVYPGGTRALESVDLEIPAGKVFGLIGRNGAGKTTFVRIAATQLMPTSGEVSVLGYDVLKQVDEVRMRIASVPQESRPLYFVSVEELIYTYLRARGAERTDARQRTLAAMEEFSLTKVRRVQVNRLSGGTRRRAMVAMILACDAEVLFLDEPTTGLDPLARREVWTAIRRARTEGRTVILTTHYLDEAEALSSRIALLDGGRVKLEGSPDDLRGRVRRPFRVTVHGALGRSELESYGDVSEIEGGFLVFARERDAQDLAAKALGRGARVSLAPVTLEDIFLQVVGSRLDEESTADTEAA